MKVELTVKEMMALAGAKFAHNQSVSASAKKKLQEALNVHYHIEDSRPLN